MNTVADEVLITFKSWMPQSRICRYFPVRSCGLIILYTFDFKKFTMFLKFFLKMRPSSKVGTAMARPTGPVQPGLKWDFTVLHKYVLSHTFNCISYHLVTLSQPSYQQFFLSHTIAATSDIYLISSSFHYTIMFYKKYTEASLKQVKTLYVVSARPLSTIIVI